MAYYRILSSYRVEYGSTLLTGEVESERARAMYEYELQGNYGYGWDTLTTESTRKDINMRLSEYRANERGVMLRIKRVKVVA